MTGPFDERFPDPDALFGALADGTARAVLAALHEPATAGELAEHTDLAESTVYDKLERLEEAGLVDAALRVRDDGNHDTVYAADVDRIVVERAADGELALDVRRPDRSAAERLTEMWSEVKRS